MEVHTPEQISLALLGKHTITCAAIHTGPCILYWIKELLQGLKVGLKFYLPLHVLPMALRYKKLLKDPKGTVLPAMKSALRSAMMLAGMASIGKVCVCTLMRAGILNKGLILISGVFGVQAALIESPSRISEMVLYVMPRFLDSFWNFLIRRNWVKNIPGAQVLLFCMSMAAIMYSAKYEPENIKPMYRTVCNKFFGADN